MTTLGVIVVVALLFGLLAALDVQRAFDPIFDIVLTVIGRVMFVLLTPIFWAVNWVLSSVLGNSSLDFPEQFRRFGEQAVQPAEDKTGCSCPAGQSRPCVSSPSPPSSGSSTESAASCSA